MAEQMTWMRMLAAIYIELHQQHRALLAVIAASRREPRRPA
jgi:hypothetical protein